jgi:hypothetical protein
VQVPDEQPGVLQHADQALIARLEERTHTRLVRVCGGWGAGRGGG